MRVEEVGVQICTEIELVSLSHLLRLLLSLTQKSLPLWLEVILNMFQM